MEERFRELEQYLEGLTTLRARERPTLMEREPGLRYNCLEEAVLREGVRFRHGRSSDVPRWTPKRCFNNAYDLLLQRDDLYYCEGWATSIIGVHHAWLCDANGVIYDPTWWQDYHSDEDAYIGLVFDTEYVLEHALKTGVAGVFYGDRWIPNFDVLRGEAKLAEVNFG